MFDYIKGKIINILPNAIILDNNNIGYLIKTPSPSTFTINDFITIYIYEAIKEDAIDLYGFKTIDERDLFLKLLSVKGLGAKASCNILAFSKTSDIIEAIVSENINFFKKIPSIGPKTSQQIIIDLKNKFNIDKKSNTEIVTNLTNALKALGYTNQEIKTALKNIPINNYTNIQEALKDALKLLN